VAFQVKEIQATPNPNAVKFMLDRVIASAPTSFFNAGEAQTHAVAAKLFAIRGVNNVLLLGDFVTVGKEAAAKWSPIQRQIRAALEAADLSSIE